MTCLTKAINDGTLRFKVFEFDKICEQKSAFGKLLWKKKPPDILKVIILTDLLRSHKFVK